MENKFVSLVIYLHNDAEYIERFLDAVIVPVTEKFCQFEMIFVDDGCQEYTVKKLRECIERKGISGMVSILHMGFHQGIEAAMNAGRDASIGDFVYEFDSMIVDYDSELIYEVYEKLLTGYDIVSATNNIDRSLASKSFYGIFNRYSNSRAKIGTETFRLISRRAINRVKSLGTYIPYRKAVYANCGLDKTDVVYESKLEYRNRKEAMKLPAMGKERRTLALDSFIYFTNVMEKISTIISAVFLVFSLFMIIYSIADYFLERTLAEGWASLMCFMSLGFFGVFMLLTIILKYLSVLLNLEFKKQKYLVSDIEKIR